MRIESAADQRNLHLQVLQTDLAIIGGGLAGTCAAITAARAGIQVVLLQDRPVLGGNASSEVRLWVLGATSHMGNNNRWAREGGVIDELLLENAYRNPEGNPLIFDTILLEKIKLEKNIVLLLNTAVYEVEKKDSDTLAAVHAFCSQNSTKYRVESPLFCDASGDGIVGFLAGAAFRMGAESKTEFGEGFAPTEAYGELLGHSLYFYSKDTGRKVRFVPPQFALQDITEIPRFKNFKSNEFGCRLWWIEYGGRLDTVHETETIKWELWKVVYGVWHYIKNSGQFPEADNLTLEWVGTIPGKRESRRFEGDYILKQQDIIEQRVHADAVAYGGWSIDLHPADGVFSALPGCNQWHAKGIYGIPYRTYYSKNIQNLFLAGRIMSASHVAFGSSRVMATCAHGGQAIGLAAALCKQYQKQPREIGQAHIQELQQALLRTGQHLPGLRLKDASDLVQQATALEASSTFILQALPKSGPFKPIHQSVAQMLPLNAGPIPTIHFHAKAEEATSLQIELRVSSKVDNHTPDTTLAAKEILIQPGTESYALQFEESLSESTYVFLCFLKNEAVSLALSDLRTTGILTVYNDVNPAVSNYGKQTPPEDIGVEAFEFWCPKRRPEGKNLALQFEPAIQVYAAEHLRNGLQRPVSATNAWAADPRDREPTLTIRWSEPVQIQTLELFFDTDLDHPLETVLMLNPETKMPFCVDQVKVFDDQGALIAEIQDQYLSRRSIQFPHPIHTQSITLQLSNSHAEIPVSLFEIRCYA